MKIITILITIILIALSLCAICIKIILKKDGKFSGTCASNNPFLNKNGEKCGYCGAEPGDQCKNDSKSEVK